MSGTVNILSIYHMNCLTFCYTSFKMNFPTKTILYDLPTVGVSINYYEQKRRAGLINREDILSYLYYGSQSYEGKWEKGEIPRSTNFYLYENRP